MLRVLDGTNADASSLVRAGLWDEAQDGWIFHDWHVYNPDSATLKAKRDAESEGGKRGNHARWHAKQGITVPECEYCQPSTGDRVPDQVPDSPPDRVSESGANPPDPTRPDPTQKTSTTPPADAVGFDDFWAAYPRKLDKGKARPAWARAIKKASPERIVASAKSYAASPDAKPDDTN